MTASFVQDLDRLTSCPHCHVSWDGGSVFETLRTQDWCRDMTDEELQKHVEEFYSPPYRWGRLIGIETEGYDGVSFWQCPDCGNTWRRFND